MRKLMIVGLIACSVFTVIGGCGKKVETTKETQVVEESNEDLVKEENLVKEEVEEEASDTEEDLKWKDENLSPEEQFLEFLKTDLNEEEKQELLTERVKDLEDFLNKENILYTNSDNNLYFENDLVVEDYDLRSLHFRDYNSDILGGSGRYMYLAAEYNLKESTVEFYHEGYSLFDIGKTNFQEIFKICTGMDLDSDKINDLVIDHFNNYQFYDDNYISENHLDGNFDLIDSSGFIYLNVHENGFSVSVSIPYREKI